MHSLRAGSGGCNEERTPDRAGGVRHLSHPRWCAHRRVAASPSCRCLRGRGRVTSRNGRRATLGLCSRPGGTYQVPAGGGVRRLLGAGGHGSGRCDSAIRSDDPDARRHGRSCVPRSEQAVVAVLRRQTVPGMVGGRPFRRPAPLTRGAAAGTRDRSGWGACCGAHRRRAATPSSPVFGPRTARSYACGGQGSLSSTSRRPHGSFWEPLASEPCAVWPGGTAVSLVYPWSSSVRLFAYARLGVNFLLGTIR